MAKVIGITPANSIAATTAYDPTCGSGSLLLKVAAEAGKVVDDKWLATIAAAVQGELDRISQTLTGRIRQLAERYATPLPRLTDEVVTLSARVAEQHLKKMGFQS